MAIARLDPTICLVYLDDIIVDCRNLSAHLDRLRLLFDRLLVTGLQLNLAIVDYCGPRRVSLDIE